MKSLIIYSIAGTIVWVIAQALGAGLGVSLFAALLVPPVLHLAFLIYRNR